MHASSSAGPRSTPSATVMLRTRSDSDEPSGNLSQDWKPFQKAKHKRQRIFEMRSLASNHAAMNENLHCLNEPRRPFAARLHFAQIVHGNRTGSQFFREQIGSRNGILDSEIDADAACRRHRMRRIADAKQPVAA